MLFTVYIDKVKCVQLLRDITPLMASHALHNKLRLYRKETFTLANILLRLHLALHFTNYNCVVGKKNPKIDLQNTFYWLSKNMHCFSYIFVHVKII